MPAVFNLDIPFNAEDYVHRIGRTGRAGASGIAISFVSAKDARLLADVEKLIGKKAEVEPIELEADRRRFGGSPGRQNDGQRVWHDPQARSELRGGVRSARPVRRARRQIPSSTDPTSPSWLPTPGRNGKARRSLRPSVASRPTSRAARRSRRCSWRRHRRQLNPAPNRRPEGQVPLA